MAFTQAPPTMGRPIGEGMKDRSGSQLRPALLWRWRRFRRDCGRAASWRTWLPVVAGSAVASGLILVGYTAQSERYRNDLIRRYGVEKLDFLANNLIVETTDWSTWDETYRHAKGLSPDYYGSGNYNRHTFLRTPFVMVLDRRGAPVSSAHWNDASQRIEPLSERQQAELLRLIPWAGPMQAGTFMAMFEGAPYLMSAQLIYNSTADQPAAGRLLFVRPLQNRDNEIARNALALQAYHFEPARAVRSALFGPIGLAIRNPKWDGRQPLQITVLRPAQERFNALRAFALLLLIDAGLLAWLVLRAYRQQRLSRHQACRQLREQQRLRRALYRRQNIDELTGLLNQQGLMAAMERQRQQWPRASRALLLIDLNHFSLINHSMGRTFGDQVLIAAADWLRRQLPGSALLARTAGDEFSCSLVDSSVASLRAEITRVTSLLSQLDLQVKDQTIRITACAGARLLTDVHAEEALHDTGLARDLAKLSGRQQCQFYGDELTTMQNYVAIQGLNQDLVSSLQQDRIALFAQAAWRLDHSSLPPVYVEFLSRIHDPQTQTYRWSEALVEAASYCGTMPLLDHHILELSFQQLHQLLARHRDNVAIQQMVYAINLTPDTLLAQGFVGLVEALIDRHQLDPRRLCFEITEQAAVRNLEGVRQVILRIRELGIRFSLDDFGAGMTSLSYLRDLPLDYVKIDKAFIARVKGDAASRLTVEFLVRMGRELGFETIAEGVEDPYLLYYLRDLGVSIAQGYVTAIPSLFDPDSACTGFARSGQDLIGEILGQVA